MECFDDDFDENSFFDLRTKKGQIVFILITSIIAVTLTQLPFNDIKDLLKPSQCSVTSCQQSNHASEQLRKPTFWIYGVGGEGQWIHVNKVLERLGLERVTENQSDTADLLWAHDYPFTKLRSKILDLKPHQKVNHIPGCGFLTNKIDLATTKLKIIPISWKLPKDKDDFMDYAKSNPEKLFVVKHHQHRHIKVKNVNEINFNDNETFVQEFIENPLLVDGHKFDIGVYVIITSIDPLRVYIYYGDILFRYCSQKYHPFDPENVDKYIVGDNYIPTWEMPSLARYYNGLGFGMKGSFDAYIRSKQLGDPQKIWDQVEDAIRVAILSKESQLNDIMSRYNYKQNFFEMARFDLIVDANLKVYLMEANMSPNLSSAHFKQNFILYEQVLYNVLNLVGVGHYLSRESLKKLDVETEIMLSTDKNVMVNGEICGKHPCAESCAPIECVLCKPCLSAQDTIDLHRAYREHINRGDTKRIFPVRITNPKISLDNDSSFQQLSPRNQMMTRWFQGKCLTDSNWC